MPMIVADRPACRHFALLTRAAVVAAMVPGVVACGASPPAAPPPAQISPAATAPAAMPNSGAASRAAAVDDRAPADTERGKAFGYFIDSPRPFAVFDQGMDIAEQLRRRYGMDSGNPDADRRVAALKFQGDVLDRLVFSDEEIAATVHRLGFSLDPARCGNACENVRRLGIYELQKEALEAFADGRPMPGRIP